MHARAQAPSLSARGNGEATAPDSAAPCTLSPLRQFVPGAANQLAKGAGGEANQRGVVIWAAPEGGAEHMPTAALGDALQVAALHWLAARSRGCMCRWRLALSPLPYARLRGGQGGGRIGRAPFASLGRSPLHIELLCTGSKCAVVGLARPLRGAREACQRTVAGLGGVTVLTLASSSS